MNRWKQGGPSLARQFRSMQDVDMAQAALLTLLSGASHGGRGGGGGKGPRQPGGTASANTKEKAEWCCRYADCRSAGRMNRPGNAKCFGCQRAKGEALNPPLALARQASGPPTFAAAAKAVAKAKGGTAPKPNTAATQEQSLSPQSLAVWEKVTVPTPSLSDLPCAQPAANGGKAAACAAKLPAELADSIDELKPALGPVIELLGRELMPRATSLDEPEAVMASYLKGVGQCSAAAEVLSLEARVQAAQAALPSLEGTAAGKALEKQIADDQAAVTRIRKVPTSADAMRLGLTGAKDRFLADRQAKIDAAAKGEAASKDRATSRATLLAALRRQLDDFSAGIAKAEVEHAQAHAARNAQRVCRDAQVAALFDARIAAAAPASAPPDASVAPSGPAGASFAPAAPAMVTDVESQTTELVAARQRAAELEEQLQRFREHARRMDGFLAVVADPPDVASLALPNSADATLMARANALHQLLTQWSAGGMELPLAVGELAAPCGVDDAGALLAALLGEATGRLLPCGLQPETILPKQVMQVLVALLARLEARFVASAAAKTKAAAAYAELAAKRPRHMP